MGQPLSPTLLEILKTTLRQVEETFDSPRDEPVLRELKQSVTIAIGELEMSREPKQAGDPGPSKRG